MKKMVNYILKSKKTFIGLEDSKRTWKICVRSEGIEVHNLSIPSDYANLKQYLKNNFPDCDIELIYEAGFRGFGLYDRLVEDGVECVVTPPHTVTEAKANKVKTDKVDARRLAKVLENDDCGKCYVPDKERRTDRQISRTLVSIQKHITSVRNQIRKLCDFHGLALKLPAGAWNKSHYDCVEKLDMGNDALNLSIKVLFTTLNSLLESVKQLRDKLKELTKKDRYKDVFKLIASAPGVGWFTAIRLVLEWGEDLSRFTTGKHFASFNGLTMREHSTGETIHKGRITGQSHNFLRGWLIQCAWTAYSRDPVLLKKFTDVWHNSGSKKKAIVAVARKLVVRLRGLVVSGKPYCIGVIE